MAGEDDQKIPEGWGCGKGGGWVAGGGNGGEKGRLALCFWTDGSYELERNSLRTFRMPWITRSTSMPPSSGR